MDTFYKPPMQNPNECEALEDNYQNCIFQKAVRDKVLLNKCRLESILWFHLECPLKAKQYDNPTDFKRKFRQFFAENRTIADFNGPNEVTRTVKQEYNYSLYPEDVREF